MDLQTKPFTVEDFDRLIELPENADKVFEFIGGELVEVGSNAYSSKISSRLNRFLGNYVDENDLGHISGEAGLYKVSGERYAPDVGYVSIKRQEELDKKGANSIAPDLAVEVISPSDSTREVSTKISNYLAAGTVVWVVYPDEKIVMIHEPGQPVKTLAENDTLDGGKVLPGFSVPLTRVFRKTGEKSD